MASKASISEAVLPRLGNLVTASLTEDRLSSVLPLPVCICDTRQSLAISFEPSPRSEATSSAWVAASRPLPKSASSSVHLAMTSRASPSSILQPNWRKILRASDAFQMASSTLHLANCALATMRSEEASPRRWPSSLKIAAAWLAACKASRTEPSAIWARAAMRRAVASRLLAPSSRNCARPCRADCRATSGSCLCNHAPAAFSCAQPCSLPGPSLDGASTIAWRSAESSSEALRMEAAEPRLPAWPQARPTSEHSFRAVFTASRPAAGPSFSSLASATTLSSAALVQALAPAAPAAAVAFLLASAGPSLATRDSAACRS
mmetsp:Transcript_31819/g.72431  ORF Transcript_31819/g.72431 Transcript_31819/m.72431 type:complete len:320 (-) Transcript_31819:91-1050(-)